MPQTPLHVSVSGTIGAGKSVLSQKLGAVTQRPVIEEDVSGNPYLSLFYANPKRWAWETQVRFLARRFKDQRHSVTEYGTTGSITERSCYEDAIFARMLHKSGTMDDNAFATYEMLFETLEESSTAPLPDAIIFLDAKPETALERVRDRARECEANMQLSYLTSLAEEYETFVSDMSKRTCVVRVDWSSFERDTARVWKRVCEMYGHGPGLYELAFPNNE